MKFVFPRNFTIKGLGQSLRFTQGVPLNVPTLLESEVRKWGGVPADGEESEVAAAVEAEESKNPGFQTPADEPQGDTRERILLDACDALVGRNGKNDFGANGAPKTTAIKDLIGFRIDANERNAVWELYNKRKNEALHPSNSNVTEVPPNPDSAQLDNVSNK